MYTIGKLATRARINSDSIRFYERQGLILPAQKTSSGYRLYTDDALRRIAFIKHSQKCGFSLAEIRQLLEVRDGAGGLSSDVRQLAIRKKAVIEDTITALAAMSMALSQLIDAPTRDAMPGIPVELDENPLLRALHAGLAQQASAEQLRHSLSPLMNTDSVNEGSNAECRS